MDTRETGQKLSRQTAQPGDTVDVRWQGSRTVTRATLTDWTTGRITMQQDGRAPGSYRFVDVKSVTLVEAAAK
jgi:hypothetical protein